MEYVARLFCLVFVQATFQAAVYAKLYFTVGALLSWLLDRLAPKAFNLWDLFEFHSLNMTPICFRALVKLIMA
jgi:hypothetical protein